VQAWEQARSWDALIEEVVAPPLAQAKERTTINDATSSFRASRENCGIEASTVAKYRTFVKQLNHYCDSRGYVMIDQLTVADMDRFYASWRDGKRASAKKLERLKSFVKFSVKREWMTKDLRAPEGSSIPANKTPFTAAEMDRIYAACDAIGGPTHPGPGHTNWAGEDMKDFIMLSVYTGLRISDVATFDITERLKGNNVFVRVHKTKKELYTWIPDWLVSRLHARQKLGKVFSLAGPFDERPTPHRLRHTFVRILLEKGVPVADVAELIGDTEEVVRKHYARWVPERQARLTKILKEAFDDKPKAKLVAIPGGRS
jgi:site-specific recombinase XerD